MLSSETNSPQLFPITVVSRFNRRQLLAKVHKPPTLNDVAELAGVSRATASRALAGYGRISDQTVAQVKLAAQQLGYRPNEVARAMRAGKTKTIGLVVISDFTNAFFDRATKAIIDAAKKQGYQTLVSHTDERIENERQAVKTLVEKRVDGLILVPSSDSDHAHLSQEHIGDTPIVLIDRRLESLTIPAVTTGDFEGARDAVLYVLNRGHKNLAFIVAVPGVKESTTKRPHIPISTVLDRTNGFLEGAKEGKVSSEMVFCEDSQAGAEEAVERLLSSKPRATAFFTSNNDMLLALLRVAGKLGITIGKDISVVSFDDSPWAAAMSPAITVVSRPVDELGKTAVELLLDQITGLKKTESVVLSTALIERDSVEQL
jgi:LacI family transcriptional regulator